jgi:hypothetical protein
MKIFSCKAQLPQNILSVTLSEKLSFCGVLHQKYFGALHCIATKLYFM